MAHRKRIDFPWLLGGILCIGLMAVAAGCAQKQVRPARAAPDRPPSAKEQVDRLEAENQSLQKELTASEARIGGLERTIADLEIQVLQSEALINELQRRALDRQKQLDGAITEVVRTKSKLRSIESKAEAASTIAEAEIAVKAMKNRIEAGDREKSDTLAKAEGLLQQSVVEFDAHNFGGALYLAVQAKNQVGMLDLGLRGADTGDRLAGEKAFDQPLPLKLAKNTNLRSGPGLAHAIRSTLESGTVIVGYAHKDEWIRVETEEGQSGWVHQSLVMAR